MDLHTILRWLFRHQPPPEQEGRDDRVDTKPRTAEYLHLSGRLRKVEEQTSALEFELRVHERNHYTEGA